MVRIHALHSKFLPLLIILTGPKLDQHGYASPPSEWTDDTDQSLLILLSFLASGGAEIDAYDFAKRIKFWVKNGLRCLGRPAHGVGHTVGGVVRDEGFENDPYGTAVKFWEGKNRQVASNGAVMRAGIIGALVFRISGGVDGVDRAMDVAAVRNELLTLQDFDNIMQRAVDFIQSPHLPPKPSAYIHSPPTNNQIDELRSHVYAETLKNLDLDGERGNGYTFTTLGAGTWALRQAIRARQDELDSVFERCITEITMQGGDADTNAAVAGSLLGAYLSNDLIPVEWTRHLKGADWLVQKAKAVGYLMDPDGVYPAYDWTMDQDVSIEGGKGPSRTGT
ncbi:hypothetical protein FRC06_007456 [Ceratobasidium sp. 370]|nr:hypothetical protein FRC06_007456 [Ceratobasidium sp. 370]